MFEVNTDEILNFNNVGEFVVWFNTLDEFIEIENVDALLAELSLLDKPDYFMYVYFFKQDFLKDD